MHKGIICLTEANDREEAISKVDNFLEQYGDGDVWDWYVIGGRWSGTLSELNKKFNEKVREHLKNKYPNNIDNVIYQTNIDESKDELQELWVGMGGTTINPCNRDNYKADGHDDDCLPLSECIEVVNDWKIDLNDKAEEYFKKLLEARAEKDKYDMSAYYAGLYKNAKYDAFSFESNVYDIDNETNNPANALKNPAGWYAVMIDIHN